MPHHGTGAVERDEMLAMRNALVIVAAILRPLYAGKNTTEVHADRQAIDHAIRLFDRANAHFLNHEAEVLFKL